MNNKDLRAFGLIWALIFLIVAFLPLINGHELRIWAVLISFLFTITSLFFPNFYKKTYFYQTWIRFGSFIGKINSKIIITILFYAIFLPIGIILRILGKDLLNKKIDKTLPSYFIDRKAPLQNMKNQF